MSEPQMISPMLDNFIMGGAMSEHHGVCCYPAIENGSNERFIVKVVSVPATSTQLDALLLTGAYTDKESALNYFKDLADGVMNEVDTLEKLTELEGFIAFQSSQMVPKESGDGFDIYLLSTYKRTLQKHFTRHCFTHLDALNLGLDLCAALSVCRRLGYLYVDLKPNNIFVNDQRLFRIGDLGFMQLDTLKYASLPDKYISTYTPPEIRDAFSALNTTMDIYATGLILYQAYNNGELPFNNEIKPGDPLPAPLYADYEMSEIILKACATNPEDRWQDPTQMGQAIISYMQRNGASDSPIVPVAVAEPSQEPTAEQESPAELSINAEADSPVLLDTQDESTSANIIVEDIKITPSCDAIADPGLVITEDLADEAENKDETNDSSYPEQNLEDSVSNDTKENSTTDNLDVETETDPAVEISDDLLGSTEDETDDIDPNDEIVLTEEVSTMLSQADELVSADVPEPVYVPDHVDVPEIAVPEEQPEIYESADAEDEESDGSEQSSEEEIPTDNDVADEAIPSDTPPVMHHWLRNAFFALLLLVLFIGGFFFYKNYYLLPVENIKVEGSMDTLTVYITSEIDESMLTVVCSDTYGNKIPAPVINGKAEFSGLVPDTAYTVKVTVKGFHRLTGNTKTTYSTPLQSKVVQFNAVTGTTDDSAILSFTVEGPNVDEWTVYYTADGEEEKSASFTSHMVTLTGLTVGKEYTFRLEPNDDLYVTGQTTIQFTPNGLILAENLRVNSCVNGTLSISWDVPKGNIVENWSVQCFNDTYNQTIITTETTAIFTDLDSTAAFTIEVKSAGMSIGQSVIVPANSITAENFNIDTTDPTKIILSWVTGQNIPEDGWFLRYSVSGIDNTETIPCDTNTVVISPVIPNATYKVHLEDADGNVLLGSVNVIKTAEPVPFTHKFADFTAKASDLQFTMVRTPKHPGWGRLDLDASDYRTSFEVGEHASYLVRFDRLYDEPNEEVTILLVIRNQDDNPIHSSIQVNTWEKMWPLTYFKLNAPVMPGSAGQYTMDIYFNGMLVHEQSFTVK